MIKVDFPTLKIYIVCNVKDNDKKKGTPLVNPSCRPILDHLQVVVYTEGLQNQEMGELHPEERTEDPNTMFEE